MSYVLCLIHLIYFSLMLGRVMLTCDSFALVGWTSTHKGGLILDNTIFVWLSWFEINWLFCFCCSFVPKIYVQIGTEQELEKVDVKYFSMALPAMWVMVYSSGCPVVRDAIRVSLRPPKDNSWQVGLVL